MQSPVIEITEGLERKVTITIEDALIAEKKLAELKKIAPKAKIAGFRKGKIPPHILEQHYGHSVLQDVISELMHNKFYDFVINEKIELAGRPDFKIENVYTPGENFQFVAIFEVYPEVKLTNLDKIKVERPVVEITDTDVENMKETVLKQRGTWQTVDVPAENGKRVIIDFVGFVDGEEFAGGTAENTPLILGQGQMIPGFEDAILGKKAGDTFDINVTFPENYQAENLKGKPAKFVTTLKKVEELVMPELTTEIIKEFSPNCSTEVELVAEIKQNMQRERDRIVLDKVKEQLLAGLCEQNNIDVPKNIIAEEIVSLKQQMQRRFGQNNPDMQLPDEFFNDQARKNVQVGLLLRQFIDDNKITVNDDKVEKKIETIASAYEDKTAIINNYKSNKNLMNNIKNMVIEEEAIEQLLTKVALTDKTITFDELVK